MKRIAILASFVVVAAGSSCSTKSADIPPPIVLTTPSMTVTIGSPAFSLEVKNGKGEVVLRSFSSDPTYAPISITHRSTQFRTHIIEGWDYQTAGDAAPIWVGGVVRSSHTDRTASIDLDDGRNGVATAHVEIAIDGSDLKLDATFAGKWGANADDDMAPPGLNLASMAFELPKDEHFYGLGEHLVSVDHRGRSMYNWVEEGGIGLGEQAPPGPNNPSPNGPSMSHSPVPFMISTKGYSTWLDTGFRTGLNLGEERMNAWRLWAFEPAIHAHFFVREDPKDSIADFTAKTGRARLPAPWVLGPRKRMDSGGKVMGMPELQVLRNLKIPMTTADDAMHFLPIGSQVGREAELTKWTADLHALGYKVLCYYNAYVSVTDPRATADRDEARAKGYLVKMDDGSEFDTFMISAGPQTVATIDFTNPAAIAWYGTLLQRSIDIGYDGFMLDFGEYLPPKAKMFDGRSGWEAHNPFPVLYQKATWDYMNSKKGTDWEFFARAGYTGTQAVIPMHWSGDPAASFDDAKGLPSSVRAGITAGMSGIPLWGSDMSGYTCLNDPPADKDVYIRWLEFAALSPDMHEENACSGTMPQQKWTMWSDAETTQMYAFYSGLHTRLFPYLYAVMKEAAATGMPVMRHPWLVHPTVPESFAIDLEYYFGPSLYVAPVVRRKATTRTTWLPPGKWVDWFSFEPLASGMVTRNAPLTTIPLFLKSGGIVPMLDPTVQTLAPATDQTVPTMEKLAGVLDVRAAVDLAAPEAKMTLVDGTTLEVKLAQGAIALPNGVMTAPDEATLSTCMSSCGLVESMPGGVTRVRISTDSEPQGSLAAGGLTLGHGGTTQRIRWDVAVLP